MANFLSYGSSPLLPGPLWQGKQCKESFCKFCIEPETSVTEHWKTGLKICSDFSHLRLLMSWRVVGGGIKTQECLLLIKNKQERYFHWARRSFQKWKCRESAFVHDNTTPTLHQISPPSVCDLQGIFSPLQIKLSSFFGYPYWQKTNETSKLKVNIKYMFPKKEYVGNKLFFIETEHILQLIWAGWEWTPSSSCSEKCWKTPNNRKNPWNFPQTKIY